MIARAAVGFAAAAVVAEAGRRAGALTSRGAVAATITGAVTVAAGARWGVLLVAFFIAGSALSRVGAPAKVARTAAIVEKSGARDAWQVAANGAVFALLALASTLWSAPWLAAAALAGLSGAFGDTAATEVGTLFGGQPRSIITGRPLATGMSGGVTVIGSAAAVVAVAAFAWMGAQVVAMPQAAAAACLGGVGGVGADSLVGATLQERRWCPACTMVTERRTHDCGAVTQQRGGVAGWDNDVVNLAATAIAAALGAVAFGLMEPG